MIKVYAFSLSPNSEMWGRRKCLFELIFKAYDLATQYYEYIFSPDPYYSVVMKYFCWINCGI